MTPAMTTPTVRRVVATGRFMKGAEMFMFRSAVLLSPPLERGIQGDLDLFEWKISKFLLSFKGRVECLARHTLKYPSPPLTLIRFSSIPACCRT